MGNHTEGHKTLASASLEYPQMYPDKTYDHYLTIMTLLRRYV